MPDLPDLPDLPDWLWMCIAIFCVYVLYVVGKNIQSIITRKPESQDGVIVVAYVIVAADKLYLTKKSGLLIDRAAMKVVFTLNDELSDEHLAKLQSFAETLRTYVPSPSDENQFALVAMKYLRPHCQEPVPLPPRLTNGEEVYAGSVDAQFKFLPNGYLSQPYVHCKAVIGTGGGIRLIQSPETDVEESLKSTSRRIDKTANPTRANKTASSGRTEETENVPSFHIQKIATVNVRAMFARGELPPEAFQYLVKEGYPEDSAHKLIAELWREHGGGRRLSGLKSAAIGLLTTVGGIVLSVTSLNEAQARGESKYVLFIGLILGGFVLFIRGLVRMILGSKTTL